MQARWLCYTRTNFSGDILVSLQSPSVPSFQDAHVLVVGDVMLDRYWYGSVTRISPEAPVPTVHIQDMEERPGGAGNVAVNVAALGAHASLIAVTGEDEAAAAVEALLRAQAVDCRLMRRSGYATVTKLRVLSRRQQLIRLDFEDARPQGGLSVNDPHWRATLADAHAVVLSDYGKGALDRPQDFIRQAREAGRPVLVDPKGRDFTGYRGASVVTPNLGEFEAVVGECHDLDVLVSKGNALCRDLDLDALLITRGELGATLVGPALESIHLPARAREVYDVTGAGDTVVGVLAAGIAAGQSLAEAAALANEAAGLVVGKMGTAVVSVAELRHVAGVPGTRGVMDASTLLERVRASRARGETVVMTNGCFDILHAGHVRFLNQAKSLGDRLVVAVNDDASVKRLKGHDRPINPLSRRLDVLDALDSVDWVVPFSEDTPERLICTLAPDVLVKGGDYQPDTIAGRECVRSFGGRVVVLEYNEGSSTTAIIEAIQRGAQQREEGVETP